MNTTPALVKVVRLAATVVVVDLSSKAIASVAFATATTGVIVPVENPEFSLGTASAPFPVMIALMAAGIMVAGALTTRAALGGRLPIWVPATLIGGSVANLADRAFTGVVHDFLATPWVVLNVADLAVVAAVIKLSAAPLISTFARTRGEVNQ